MWESKQLFFEIKVNSEKVPERNRTLEPQTAGGLSIY